MAESEPIPKAGRFPGEIALVVESDDLGALEQQRIAVRRVDAVERAARARESGGASNIFTDHVIAATGFRVDFDRLAYIDPALRAGVARVGGSPALSAGFETSVPGLFAVGAMGAATFGPVMRFMYGAKHAAPLIARRLAANAGRAGE